MSEGLGEAWSIEGSEGLTIDANTHRPVGGALAQVVIVHGWTGCKDRNIVTAVTHGLRDRCVVHRITLSHAGIERDGDQITRPDEFARDALEYCVEDIRLVLQRVREVTSNPLVLIGHSRAGATIMRVGARASREGWAARPDALVSIAGTSTYTRFDAAMRRELSEKGYVERPCARAPGGVVRMGPSWYRHHLDHPDRDLFAEDASGVPMPVLIVHGEADDAVPIDHAARVVTLLEDGACPRVRLVRVPGADHNFNAGGFGFDRHNIETEQSRSCCEAILSFIEDL